jgi:hypothetical protein
MSTNNLPAQNQSPVPVGFFNSDSYALAKKISLDIASSNLIPARFQNQPANCLIALNMANRIGADPMMVMQNLYVVHGTPSWSAQFLIATFNKSGSFSSIRYEFSGVEGQDNWGCRAKATELSTGELLTGPLVTIGIAKKEGWYQKSGSKWQTMPEQMLRYRAAAWFVRTIAPEIAMGLQTSDEVADTYELEREGDAFVLPPKGQTSSDLNAMLHPFQEQVAPIDAQPPAEAAPEPQLEPKAEPAPEPGQMQAEEQKAQRRKKEEMDGMRVDLVEEIAAEGLDLKAIEHAVRGFSNQWSVAQMDKIRTIIIPNMKAEKAELV